MARELGGLLPRDVEMVKQECFPNAEPRRTRLCHNQRNHEDEKMRSWKFWEKPSEESRRGQTESAPARRFSAKPRTDLINPAAASDPAKAEQLARLRRRREAVLFDVEQSEMASSPDNVWQERVALIDEALASVRADRDRLRAERQPAGRRLQPTPIEDVSVAEGPPPAVSFRIGDERFQYEEELDWAERGFQLARSELQPRAGDPAKLIPASVQGAERDQLLDHLTGSLFVFASHLRDRALAGEPLPANATLADLAKPDTEHGGWLDWDGVSPVGTQKNIRLRALDAEEQRLLDERSRELEEMARLADRLPIARRRLANVDDEIAALRL
jgi:hypothetical protein